MTVSDKKEINERLNGERALTLGWAIDMLDEIGDIAAYRKCLADRKRELRDNVLTNQPTAQE